MAKLAVKLSATEAQGRVIAAGRMLAGLDQTELAKLAKVSPGTISNVERGQTEPRLSTRLAIKKALRVRGVDLVSNHGTGLISAATSYRPTD